MNDIERTAMAADEIVERAAIALWQAWMELNTIVARDGAPWTRDGKSGVTEEYFCKVKDDCAIAYEGLTGQAIKPWPPKFSATPTPAKEAETK